MSSKPTRRELQVSLERAGAAMSNILFNVSQYPHVPLAPRVAESMDEARRNWDRAYGDIQQINQLTGTPSYEELATENERMIDKIAELHQRIEHLTEAANGSINDAFAMCAKDATASEGRIAELTAENELLRGQLQYDLTKDKEFREELERVCEVGISTRTRRLIVKSIMQAIHVYAAAQREAGRVAALAGSATPSPYLQQEVSPEILGAVARGWCSAENSHKVMDSTLAVAIAREVETMLTAVHDAAFTNGTPQDTLKNADSERLDFLRNLHPNSFSLAYNDDHACNYVTAKQWIEEFHPEDFENNSADEIQAMKDTNIIWRFQIYPHTPIGSCTWYGPTIESVIDAARTAAIESERATITKEAE